MAEIEYDGPPSSADNERALVELAAERDQLRKQVEKLLGAGDAWRKAIAPRSTHTLNAADRALLEAFDQVRKGLEGR